MAKFLQSIPIILFTVFYYKFDMNTAIIAISASCALVFCIFFILKLKIDKMMILSYLLIISTGILSIVLQNNDIFKMKPTIINLLFASILLCDIKKVFKNHSIITLLPFLMEYSEDKIRKLSTIWALYFILCAMLNEIIWRNFSEELWVLYKLVGIMMLNLGMMIYSIMFLKHSKRY